MRIFVFLPKKNKKSICEFWLLTEPRAMDKICYLWKLTIRKMYKERIHFYDNAFFRHANFFTFFFGISELLPSHTDAVKWKIIGVIYINSIAKCVCSTFCERTLSSIPFASTHWVHRMLSAHEFWFIHDMLNIVFWVLQTVS